MMYMPESEMKSDSGFFVLFAKEGSSVENIRLLLFRKKTGKQAVCA